MLAGGTLAQLSRSDETKVGQYIRDNLGIVFEYIPFAGDLREKMALMLAAGDYGELQEMQRVDLVNAYIDAGVLIDLSPYLAQMPNFTSRFKDYIPYWRLASGGPLYKYEIWIPRALDTDTEVNDFAVRSDLLEKAGWPQLRSGSDWIAFLEKVLPGAVDINGKPIAGVTWPGAEPWGKQMGIILYEKGEHLLPAQDSYFYNVTENKVVAVFSSKETKDSFKFFNQLSQKGLLDPELWVDFYDQTSAKMFSGSVAVVSYAVWPMNQASVSLAAAGHPEMAYIRLPVQSDAQVAANEKRLVRIETTRSYNSWGITKKCKDPAKLTRLIDWASSDEGQIILSSGLEGVHWTREPGGKRVWTDLFVRAMLDPQVNLSEGISGFIGRNSGLPSFHSIAGDGQPHDLSTQVEWVDGQGLTPAQKNAYTKLGWDSSLSWYNNKNTVIGYTGLSDAISIDPASDLGAINTRMLETSKKYAAPLVLAKTDAEFESVWKTAMDEYNALHPERVIDELNRQLESKVAELKKYQ